MCGQWRRRTIAGDAAGNEFLPFRKLQDIVDQAAGYSPEVYIWGGEPTLHPDFAEFIAYLKKKKFVCTVNTNGTLLKKYAGDIVASGIDSIDISLDGPPEIHDAIRGIKGTYAKIMEGLKELEEKKTDRRPLVKAVITLSEKNLFHIEKLLWDLESNHAVHMSIIQLGWFTTKQAGEIYERQLKEGFGLKATSWQGFEDNRSHERSLLSYKLIRRIRNGKYKKPILFFPDLADEEIKRYYSNHGDTLGRKGCRSLLNEMQIMPNGDVVICVDFPDIVVGNVWEQSLSAVWNGEKLRFFRKYVKEKGLFSICSRCCGFFK
jgi:radical SAM protein with 4Fe4S-binding SPASM domain